MKAGKLVPVDTGGKIRSYNLLRCLARDNRITLLTYYDGRPDPAYEADIARHFPGATSVCTGRPTGGTALALDYARHALLRAPYAVTKFTSAPVQRMVELALDAGSFDVAVCDFLSASLNFPARASTPSVLFQHNVESLLWRRQADHEANLLKRWAFRMEALKMDRYERAAVRRFPRVIAVSARDRDAMASMTDVDRLAVVPTGVDLRTFRTVSGIRPTRPLVMFLGSMDWEANIDAVVYFCRDIWPEVRAAVPDARFRIVGRSPHPRVLALASDSVEITGTVPSVVEHLADAAVLVVPLRVAGGTRLKIFEAMAAERAVVSTSIGAEGLEVADGRDVLIADTPGRFAGCVVDLLRHPARRRALETAAGRTAARHDWPVVAARFQEVLRQTCAAGRLVPQGRPRRDIAGPPVAAAHANTHS